MLCCIQNGLSDIGEVYTKMTGMENLKTEHENNVDAMGTIGLLKAMVKEIHNVKKGGISVGR